MNLRKIFMGAAIFAFTMVSLAQAEEATIADGSKVKIDYTLTVDGQIADTSQGKEPLEYEQGKQMIIPGLEKQLTGLKAGDTKTIVVPAAEAYGEINPQLFMNFPKENLKGETAPAPGMVIQVQMENGRTAMGVVQEVKDKDLLVNFNHPLAGKELKFDIKIVSIQ